MLMMMASRGVQSRRKLLFLLLATLLKSTLALDHEPLKNKMTEDKGQTITAQKTVSGQIPVDPGGTGEQKNSVPVDIKEPKQEVDKPTKEKPVKTTEQDSRTPIKEEKKEDKGDPGTDTHPTEKIATKSEETVPTKKEPPKEPPKTIEEPPQDKSEERKVPTPQATPLSEKPEVEKLSKEPTVHSHDADSPTMQSTGSEKESVEQTPETSSSPDTVPQSLETQNDTELAKDTSTETSTEQVLVHVKEGESEEEAEKDNKTESGRKDKKEEKKDEDFETYTEWRQKALAEEEKNKQTENQESSVPAPKKQNRKNNFASKECGSKILASNTESENTKAVLTANKDEYMINPCKVKKWFVVELCEPIHVKSVEVASLELFSSQPKSFKISISDRYPTKDWHLAREFQATEDRTLQNFDVESEEDFFVKYVKVEMLDHYGEEHFCPLTLFKVFGIPVEFDGLNQHEDDDSDNDMDSALLNNGEEGSDSEEPKNLFATAKDTVMKLVKKVLNVEEKAGQEDIAKNGTNTTHNATSENTTVVNGTKYLLPCTPEVIIPSPSVKEGPESTTLTASGMKPTETVSSSVRDGLPPPESSSAGIDKMEPKAEDPAIIVTKLEDHEQIPSEDLKPGNDEQNWSSQLCRTSQLSGKNKTSALCLYLILMTGGRKSKKPAITQILEKDEKKAESKSVEKSSQETQSSEDTSTSDKTPPTEVASTPVMSSNPDVTKASQTVHKSTETEKATKTESVEKSSVSGEVTGDTIMTVTSAETQVQLEPSMKSVTGSSIKATTSVQKEPIHTVTVVKTESSLAPHISDQGTTSVEATPVVQDSSVQIDVPTTSENLASSSSVVDSQVHASLSSSMEKAPGEESKALDDPTAPSAEVLNSIQNTNVNLPTLDIEHNVSTTTEDKSQLSNETETAVVSPSNETVTGTRKPAPKDLVRVPPLPMQKSSTAIMRLANRIKILESNVSLSSRFLDEMTQKFKKQSEEMLRLLNAKFDNVTRAADKRDQEQQEQINSLEHRLENLTDMVYNLQQNMDILSKQLTDRQMVMTSVEVVVLVIIFLVCMRRGKPSSAPVPVEIQKLLSNMPVSPDLSNNMRRNSFSEAVGRKTGVEDVGASLQKYGSDSVLAQNKKGAEFDPGGSKCPTSHMQQHHKEFTKKKKKKKNKIHDSSSYPPIQSENDETNCYSAGLLFGTNSDITKESEEPIKRSKSYGGVWSFFSDKKGDVSNTKTSLSGSSIKTTSSVAKKIPQDSLKNTNTSAVPKQCSSATVGRLEEARGSCVLNGEPPTNKKLGLYGGKITHKNVHHQSSHTGAHIKTGLNGQCPKDRTEMIFHSWGSSKTQTHTNDGSSTSQKTDKKPSNQPEKSHPKKIVHKRASSADFSPKKQGSSSWIGLLGYK